MTEVLWSDLEEDELSARIVKPNVSICFGFPTHDTTLYAHKLDTPPLIVTSIFNTEASQNTGAVTMHPCKGFAATLVIVMSLVDFKVCSEGYEKCMVRRVLKAPIAQW